MPEKPIQSFIDYLKFEKRYSPHTVVSYQDDLIQFFDFTALRFGPLSITEISHNIVRSWLASLKEEAYKPRTISRKISSLRSFFKYHLRQATIGSTPMSNVVSPKLNKRLPVFIKEDDATRILSNLKNHTEDWKGLNTRLLLTLFYTTGMRLAELANLREEQVDFYRNQIKVLGKGNKERIIPVNKEVMEMVKHYAALKRKEFDKPEDRLLVTEKGKKIYPKYAYNLVKNILGEEARNLEKKSPHVLRHSFATHLVNNGANLNAVKELLGHSSLGTTQIYVHNSIGKLKDVYKKAHPKA